MGTGFPRYDGVGIVRAIFIALTEWVLRINMPLLGPHEAMKVGSEPREGGWGSGRVTASAGGHGRV